MYFLKIFKWYWYHFSIFLLVSNLEKIALSLPSISWGVLDYAKCNYHNWSIMRTFKWDTIPPCNSRGCKTASDQSWKSKQKILLVKYFSLYKNLAQGWAFASNFFGPPNLISRYFAPLWAVRLHNFSFESTNQWPIAFCLLEKKAISFKVFFWYQSTPLSIILLYWYYISIAQHCSLWNVKILIFDGLCCKIASCLRLNKVGLAGVLSF